MGNINDTIAGIATAAGQGGIAIVRVSGSLAEEIMRKVFFTKSKEIDSHRLYYGHLVQNGKNLDECMAVLMRAPKSYTREDVFELHTHGGDMAARQALNSMLDCGARLAEPGEFTKRAFLNGRIDLSQAEAVMSIINASGESSLRSAARQLDGAQSKLIMECKEILIHILAGIEAAIDYPEEIDEKEATQDILPNIEKLSQKLSIAIDERAARLVQNGLEVVICGNPNAGKSTLFNALLNKDAAIVTDIPGTTRDLLKSSMILNGILVNLTDTAGIRITNDRIEAIGVQRAKKAVEAADTILYAIDGSIGISNEDIDFIKNIDNKANAVVVTKGDIASNVNIDSIRSFAKNINILFSSSTLENGVNEVREFLKSQAIIPKEMVFTHIRHTEAAKRALNSINQAKDALINSISLDLVAIDLKEAMIALGEITGETLSEELIDKIFESFCVGK